MLEERLITYLESLDSDEIIPIHNRYCEYTDKMEDYIYYMSDLPELISTKGKDALWLLKEMENIFSKDCYLRKTNHCVWSFNDCFDVISIENIVEYIIKNKNDLDNLEIEAILQQNAYLEEDKNLIAEYIYLLLRNTRFGRDLNSVNYISTRNDESRLIDEILQIEWNNGYKEMINIYGDSGIAMIIDLAKWLKTK